MLFTCATAQNKPNIHSPDTDIHLLRNTCTFPSATVHVMHNLNITVFRGTSNEYSFPQNTALAKAVHMALTCTHHKPPAWAGMSRGALPGCCVSTRRRASAGHGWRTWRADRWGENERCWWGHGSIEDLIIVCLYRWRDTRDKKGLLLMDLPIPWALGSRFSLFHLQFNKETPHSSPWLIHSCKYTVTLKFIIPCWPPLSFCPLSWPAVLWEHPVFPGDTQCVSYRHLPAYNHPTGKRFILWHSDLRAGFLELPLVKQVLPEIPSVFSFTHHHIGVAILWLHT